MASVLCLLMVIASIPSNHVEGDYLSDELSPLESNSDVVISYSNGPSSGQSLTGVYTLSFSFSGTGTVTSLDVEISDDSTAWSSIATLTSSPWVTYLDTTIFSNGTYELRATAYDSTVSENIIQLSPSFTIDNQVPVITEFSINNLSLIHI